MSLFEFTIAKIGNPECVAGPNELWIGGAAVHARADRGDPSRGRDLIATFQHSIDVIGSGATGVWCGQGAFRRRPPAAMAVGTVRWSW